MPPRRPHSKSRLGCKQCKQRRVKCDEKGPVCYNCNRRGFDCSFKYSGSPKRQPNSLPRLDTDANSHPHSPSSIGWNSNSAGRGAFTRATELELMHHYSTSTYQIFVSKPRDLDRMKYELPQWAITHQFLLDSIFALTALHIASQRPGEASCYADLAVAYQDRALDSFRKCLQAPRADQAPALFYVSALVGVITFAMPRIHPAFNDSSPTSTLIHMSRLFQGTAALVEMGKELLTVHVWEAMFPEDPKPPSSELDSSLIEALEYLKSLARAADHQILAAAGNRTPDSQGSEEVVKPVYYKPVVMLEGFFGTVDQDPNSVLAWCVMLDNDFFDRLEAGDPLARLITLFFAVLMHQLDRRWWAHGSASALVNELSPLVSAESPRWAEIARWASERMLSEPLPLTPDPCTCD